MNSVLLTTPDLVVVQTFFLTDDYSKMLRLAN